MSVRICGICGSLPCKCRIGKCTHCGTSLNLDSVGMDLMEWNKVHQLQIGCHGMVIDPRMVDQLEGNLEKQLELIRKAKKETKN